MKHPGKGNDLKAACMDSLLCLAVTLLLSLLFGKLIDAGFVSLELLPAAACAVTGLSALAGCTVTALRVKKRRLLNTLVTAGLYLVCLLLANGLMLKGEVQTLLPSLICVVSAGLLGALIGAGKRGKYAA